MLRLLFSLLLFCAAAAAQTNQTNPPWSVSLGGTDWTGQGCVGYGNAAGWIWGYVQKDASGVPHVKLDYCDGATGKWLAIAWDNPAPGPRFSDAETPAGAIDGKNAVFTLAHAPAAGSVSMVALNGVIQKLNGDYTLSGAVLTFGKAPGPGDLLSVWYRY